jgi:hypothetical protein
MIFLYIEHTGKLLLGVTRAIRKYIFLFIQLVTTTKSSAEKDVPGGQDLWGVKRFDFGQTQRKQVLTKILTNNFFHATPLGTTTPAFFPLFPKQIYIYKDKLFNLHCLV